jgi:hypothetical protein
MLSDILYLVRSLRGREGGWEGGREGGRQGGSSQRATNQFSLAAWEPLAC